MSGSFASTAAALQLHRRVRGGTEVVVLAALVIVPLFVDPFTADRLGSFLLLAILALSVDLAWGCGGILTFGHAIFFGWSAYLFAFLTQSDSGPALSPALALLLCPVAMALVGLVLGMFSFAQRGSLQGAYFSVVTFGLAVASTALALAGGSFTGGQNGILLDYQLTVGGLRLQDGYGFYGCALLLLVLAYLAVRAVMRSTAGLVLMGVRDNEPRMSLHGYDTAWVKRITLAASAGLAGVAGEFYQLHAGIVTPESVGLDLSIFAVVWVLLGGPGTLIGPVAAAILLSYAQAELSGSLEGTWLLIVGAVLVLVVTFSRGGLVGGLQAGVRRLAGALR